MKPLVKTKIFFHPRYRSLTLGSILAGLILVSMLVSMAILNYKKRFNSAKSDLTNLVRSVEAELSASFKQIDLVLLHTLKTIESESFVAHFPAHHYEKLLKFEKQFVREIFALKIIDENGNYRGDADGIITSANLSDRQYFQLQKQQQDLGFLISEPVISKSTGKWVVTLTRRLNYKDGRFAGLVLATVLLEHLQSKFQYLELNEGSVSFVSDQHYLVARHPNVEKMLGKIVINNAEIQRIFGDKNEALNLSEVSPVDGVERLYSFRRLANQKAFVVVGFSKRAITQEWYLRFGFLGISLFAICFGFSVFLFRYIQSLELLEKQKTELVSSSKMSSLGEMASGIAHEINNPLAVIQSRADHILRNLRKGIVDTDQIQTAAEKIKSTSERVVKIIQGLRNFSRNAENDPIVLVPVQEVITDVMDLSLTRLKNYSISLRIQGDMQKQLPCRKVQIEQVLLNLLNNSMDAIVGTVDPWIEIQCEAKEKFYYFRVIDSGPGIPESVRQKMLQPFFSTKEVGKGTGLGLSISLGIVHSHGGEFFYDETKKNTTFVIKLPLDLDQNLKVNLSSQQGNGFSVENYDI